MAQRDARPPFAAIDGAVPPEFSALPTPCYLLDEAALTRNAEILGGLARRTGCKVLLAQKAFSNYDLYPLLAPHLAGTEASGLFEARLGAEEMPAKKCTFSARPTAQMKWTSCCGTPTISSSTRPRSWQNLAPWPRRQAKVWDCASIPSARPRTVTRFTTPAPPAAVWARPAPSGTRQRQKILPCPGCWTACTFTLYVSRTPMRWP